ncbi:MAG: ThiF family adenylyltransferase [Syntrophobacteraceae bacterium]
MSTHRPFDHERAQAVQSLEASAYRIESGDAVQTVIEEGPLLEWARTQGVLPGRAVTAALECGILPVRYLKNCHGLHLSEQLRICRSRVLICGCGGLGGVLASLLGRAGVGFLRLADGDDFAASNLNRQWFCDAESLGRNKAETGRERLLKINPFLEVEAVSDHFVESNAHRLLGSIDLVLDALDNLPARFLLFEATRQAGLPFIHGAVAGWWGQVATFMPGSKASLGQVYGEQRERSEAEEALGVLGPAAALIGSLQSMEALRLLAGRSPAYAGTLLYYDGETGEQVMVPLQ